jgi:hypothetical protein
VTKSFKAVLAEYPRTPHPVDDSLPYLSSLDLAHLKRWADDERADKVWNTVHQAARSRDIELPAGFFIQEVLGARDIATSINHRQNNRQRYRKYAAQMEEVANVLRKRLPNRLPLMPTGEELAGRLEEAARTYRDYVAVARNETRGMNWTRESKPLHVFMSLLSNDLKDMSGKWLDDEVAVLTEIAFDKSEIDTDRVIWARRGAKRNRNANKGTE